MRSRRFSWKILWVAGATVAFGAFEGCSSNSSPCGTSNGALACQGSVPYACTCSGGGSGMATCSSGVLGACQCGSGGVDSGPANNLSVDSGVGMDSSGPASNMDAASDGALSTEAGEEAGDEAGHEGGKHEGGAEAGGGEDGGDASSLGDGSSAIDFGKACVSDGNCTAPYPTCQLINQAMICTKSCISNADCPDPPTAGTCNNNGYCK